MVYEYMRTGHVRKKNFLKRLSIHPHIDGWRIISFKKSSKLSLLAGMCRAVICSVSCLPTNKALRRLVCSILQKLGFTDSVVSTSVLTSDVVLSLNCKQWMAFQRSSVRDHNICAR